MRHTWPALLGAAALALTAAGCGDKDDEGADDGSSEDGGGVGGEGAGEGSGSGDDGAVGACVDTVIGTATGEAVASGSTSGATSDMDVCGGGDDGWSDEGSDDAPDVDGSDEGGGGDGSPPPDTGDIGWPDTGGWDDTAPDHTIQWTAPGDGWYTFYTLGSSFDTKLEVREGGCSGEVLDCDDDGGRNLDSLIQLQVSAGTTYLVTVDGYDGGEHGPYVLNIVEGRISVGGDDSGWSDEGSDGWDSGVSVDPEPDPDSDAGSWAWPGLVGAWLALMGLGGALTGRRERDGS